MSQIWALQLVALLSVPRGQVQVQDLPNAGLEQEQLRALQLEVVLLALLARRQVLVQRQVQTAFLQWGPLQAREVRLQLQALQLVGLLLVLRGQLQVLYPAQVQDLREVDPG